MNDVLFLFAFNVPLAEFTSMLWVIILHEYKSLTNKLHSRRDCIMLQFAAIASLIQNALHMVQIPDFAIGKNLPHHNTGSSMLYGWCDTEGCSPFTNSLPHIDPPIWPKDFKLWFVSPKDLIPLLQFLCTLANWSLLTLFSFLNSSFLTAILPYRPASQSLLLTADVDTFF